MILVHDTSGVYVFVTQPDKRQMSTGTKNIYGKFLKSVKYTTLVLPT